MAALSSLSLHFHLPPSLPLSGFLKKSWYREHSRTMTEMEEQMETAVRHKGWLSIFSFVTIVCSPILPRIRLLRNMNPDLGQGIFMRLPSLNPRGSLLQPSKWVGRHGSPPHLHSTARKVPLHVYSTYISQVLCFSDNPESL